MKFGTFPLDCAIGGIIAHSLRLPDDGVIKKGTVLTDELVDLLHAASLTEVMVAIPEEGDVLENEAAGIIARSICGENLRMDVSKTGRVNFFADNNGIFKADAVAINQINATDPGVSIATLPDYAEVNQGRMVATVKIIPYGISGKVIDAIERCADSATVSIVPFQAKRVGMISTLLSQVKQSVLDKTRHGLEKRLALSNSSMVIEERVPHSQEDVRQALEKLEPKCDLIVLFGASAISDRHDIIPAAIESAGGEIIRFGMPVDPGNLLLLAEFKGKPIIGAPGCARSIVENGFDWVLQRLLADISVTSDEIASMGVGGLLMETGARPHPREVKSAQHKVAAVVLAAGQSRRMGEINKLTADIKDKPMVRHVVEATITGRISENVAVVGHQKEEVQAALRGIKCRFVENPDFSDGLSTSLVAGISSLNTNITHALVLLGDMPFISRDDIDQLVEKSRAQPDKIVIATNNGKRGNPVLWPSRFFTELRSLQGDVGARHIVGANGDMVVEVELGEVASQDIDTPTTLHKFAKSPATKTD